MAHKIIYEVAKAMGKEEPTLSIGLSSLALLHKAMYPSNFLKWISDDYGRLREEAIDKEPTRELIESGIKELNRLIEIAEDFEKEWKGKHGE